MIRDDERDTDRLVLGCLAAGSVAMNLALLATLGIQHGADTDRYLAGAADVLAGRPFRGLAGSVYVGYNGLIAIAEAAGAGQLGVIAFQFFVAACAAMALYDLGRQAGGRAAGVLAAGVFIVDYDIARWHLYVLTDSLYISAVSIATWFAHRAVRRGRRAYLEAAAVLLLTAFVRPNGWILIPIVGIYWIVRSDLRARVKVAAAAAVVVMCASGAMAFAVVQFGGETPPTRALDATQQVNRQRLPFARVMTIRARLNPVSMPFRLLIELGHVQGGFSLRHKIMVVAMLAVVYPLAVLGFVRSRGQPLSRLMATIIAGHLMVVAITFSDHDGRYLLYIFPLLLVFAARGAVAVRSPR